MKIDLHSHTHYSDGKLSVLELLMRAQQMQVDVLAITDHDCVDAIEPAINLIEQNKQNIRLISGTEISTKWNGFEIHILGLDIDHQCPQLLSRLDTQLHKRQTRAQKICQKLHNIGIEGVYKDAQALLLPGVQQRCISRAHIAQVLVKRGLCSHLQQAFNQFLGKNKKAYVNPDWISIKEAIQWIKDAKGKAVIAHPFHYDMTSKWLRRLAKEFAELGGHGMEVQHPNLAVDKRNLMIEIALEAGLLGSSGSDFHGPSKWTELGRKLGMPQSITPVWTIFNDPIDIST